MTSDPAKKILGQYLKLDQEYKNYIKKFFTTTWNGQITGKAEKVVTRAEFKKLSGMCKALEKAHDAWFKAIGAFVK